MTEGGWLDWNDRGAAYPSNQRSQNQPAGLLSQPSERAQNREETIS